MNVGELKEKLSQWPDDTNVIMDNSAMEYGPSDIETVMYIPHRKSVFITCDDIAIAAMYYPEGAPWPSV